MGRLAYNWARLDSLRIAIDAALDDLHGIRSDDAAAAEAMTIVRSACRTLGDYCLPRVHDILNSEAMTSCRRANVGRWEIAEDPQPPGAGSTPTPVRVFGPELPGARSFDEVLADAASGELVPLAAPMDANGHAGSHYTSLAFAPGMRRRVGQEDLTSNMLKFVDFLSDGLPVGWREHRTLTIVYLSNVRVTSSVHVLTAYDRDLGPETLLDQTTEAIVSGYMVLEEDSTTAEVNVSIGTGEQDATQSYPIVSESSSAYSGVFYPEYAPDFQPISHEARFVNPALWTFTTSAAPMVDGWGTWGI